MGPKHCCTSTLKLRHSLRGGTIVIEVCAIVLDSARSRGESWKEAPDQLFRQSAQAQLCFDHQRVEENDDCLSHVRR